MKISVCIPMYNEASICINCADSLVIAMEKLQKERGYYYEIIFCDDGSTDGCGALLSKYVASKYPDKVRVIGYRENRGKGHAVRTSVLSTDGDCVVYTDCDLAYGTDVIGRAIKYIEVGSDMVIGSRNIEEDGYAGYSFLRKAASKTYIRVIAAYAGFHLSDSQCGFKCFLGESARRIFSLCLTNGFSFDLEAIKIAQKLDMTISEMPVKIINHRASKVHVMSDAINMLSELRRIKKRVKGLKV